VLPLLLLSFLAQAPPRPRPSAVPPLPTALYLTAKAGGAETRASVQPRQEQQGPRPLATVKAGQAPEIRWSVRNTHPKLPINNVVIHFLITKQSGPGAEIPRGPQKGTVVDTVFGTTILAKDANAGTYRTPIEEPGFYLVEVELLDPQGNRRHFLALDLKVEP